MQVVDNFTGIISKAYLFVATLPYSQYAYVEACYDMKQDTWINCKTNEFVC